MSNEELAIMIKAGDTNLLPELWDNVKKYVRWKATIYISSCISNNGYACFEVDDLINQGYIAVTEAVEFFNPEKGRFLPILDLRLKTAFHTVHFGGRSSRYLSDAALYSSSGDVALYDDGEETVLDLIPDPCSIGECSVSNQAIESLYLEQLHSQLEKCIAKLPEAQAKVIRNRYYLDRSLEEIASEMNRSKEAIRQSETVALKSMYDCRVETGLIEFLDTHTNFYEKKSLSSFKNSGESIVETLVIKREKMAQNYLRRIKKHSKR